MFTNTGEFGRHECYLQPSTLHLEFRSCCSNLFGVFCGLSVFAVNVRLKGGEALESVWAFRNCTRKPEVRRVFMLFGMINKGV